MQDRLSEAKVGVGAGSAGHLDHNLQPKENEVSSANSGKNISSADTAAMHDSMV